MSGDYSRWTFDPLRDFAAVLKQQGRVDTDADWNEWVATFLRRVQAGTLDTLGRAVVPRETPNAFRIEADGGSLTIGPGRLYVDGLLVENHGAAPAEWDPRLAEQRGTGAVAYTAQPYYPDPPALPAGGPHLVYLKAWQRELTAVEAPGLVEPALGVDTCTRLQTVWQVRLLTGVGAGVSCSTPLEDIAAFAAAEPAAAGRLTTDTADVSGEPDPCLVPPSGGYRGLENQLYRVEVHRGGPLTGADRATFKWSRDNASVATRVTAIPSLDRIVVESVGRDDLLRFSDGDWIEITDDWRELHGEPGEMRRIASGGGVDDATRTILLESPLVAGTFPVDAHGHTAPARNTRVRRWDQSGRVTDAAGDLIVDLDAAGAGGTIPVQGGAVAVALEHGIVVSFSVAAAGGVFRTGDYWVFAARSADASVEKLEAAPPLGIHAHYARLAIVTFPDAEDSCRVLWPPEAEGQGCDCTVCVSPESHASGTLTVQDAVNRVRESGGTVCLGAGHYLLGEPVAVQGARSLRLRGQGTATVLVAAKAGPVLEVRGSRDVAVEHLAVLTAATERGGNAVTLRGSMGVSLERCVIANVAVGDGRGVGIGLEGFLPGVAVRGCVLVAHTGVAGAPAEGYLATLSLTLEDNALWCSARGIALGLNSLHFGETRIAGNSLLGCRQQGITLLGGNAGAAHVVGNLCVAEGDGIVCGLDAARIADNDVRPAARARADGDGIVLARGLDAGGIDRCQVLANRVGAVGGAGIAIRGPVGSGMVKLNVIAQAGRGIVVEDDGEADVLVVENNQLLGIAGETNEEGAHLAAIQLVAVRSLDLASNSVEAFARAARQGASRAGIRLAAVDTARVAANRLAGIAPADGFIGTGLGIEALAPLRSTHVTDNSVRRRGASDEKLGSARWVALAVHAVGGDETEPKEAFLAAGRLGVAALARTTLVFNGGRLRAYAAPPPGELSVRGNDLDVEASEEPPLLLTSARGCVLNDNRVLATAGRGLPSRVRVRRAVVSGNDLRGPGDAPVLDLRLLGKGEAAIVGNLRSGAILLNGAPLGPPWAPLNPLSPE